MCSVQDKERSEKERGDRDSQRSKDSKDDRDKEKSYVVKDSSKAESRTHSSSRPTDNAHEPRTHSSSRLTDSAHNAQAEKGTDAKRRKTEEERPLSARPSDKPESSRPADSFHASSTSTSRVVKTLPEKEEKTLDADNDKKRMRGERFSFGATPLAPPVAPPVQKHSEPADEAAIEAKRRRLLTAANEKSARDTGAANSRAPSLSSSSGKRDDKSQHDGKRGRH